MKNLCRIFCLYCIAGGIISSCERPVTHNSQLSPDETFAAELLASSLIHQPLSADSTLSLEYELRQQPVKASEPIDTQLVIRFANDTGKRAVGSPDDPDYATYGSASATLHLNGRNIEQFNRISFTVLPECDDVRVTELNLAFHNKKNTEKPGYHTQSGSHLILLDNGKTNHCTYEIEELRRDEVEGIDFYVSLKGKDQTDGDSSRYTIYDIRLEHVETAEKVVGWEPQNGRIIYSTTGYSTNDKKVALMNAESAPEKFSVLDAENEEEIFSGKTEIIETTLGRFATLDFTELTDEGQYFIQAGNCETKPFRIDQHIWTNLQWKAINYLFCQRCGHPVPGIHGRCHADLYALHNGTAIPYTGGWHDAGDLSQQTLQTADVAYNLLEAEQAAATHNPALAARLHEEALWGLDFILRMRFGDGYHASSMGLLIWQDGRIGTLDDIHSVRVQDNAFDNFLYAGIEAYAARHTHEDNAMQSYLQRVAEEDFAFACAKFDAEGYDTFHFLYEHTYNTSHSQYNATLSWAASQLYQLTGKQEYAQRAVEAIRYTLSCQQTEALPDGTCGFFYRDTTRQSLVHYIHQSREQHYMQALQQLLLTQPEHPDAPKWLNAVRIYAEYLRNLMKYTQPYNMIPSGVYAANEYLDQAGMHALHLFPPQDIEARFKKQLQQGIHIGGGYYVKRFPVWFNIFNGNNAVALSQAKAAAICANVLQDEELRSIAQGQLRWLVGENPFAQSMVYGEGSRYPGLNSFSSGNMVGAMPVGIRTIGDSDEPYWPQTNNACYKEVWVTVAGKALSVIAESGL